ncbi:hypothetical protein HU200_034608 [Digitaria exilis]|uniref:Disease resistance R13L4/SHOC-2-like LRR domain-containing protein n=1 Tax=Digitaria exilis TaxID=1010633 RepID=A0A835BJF4_9POAL|nr:hypothetical protein HU200_034608 [Digitaria exilis]
MKLLRVLDLEDVTSGVTNGDVEQMVKQLPRLKFLSLRKCKQITRLPDSLGDLKQLQTLDIRGTSVIKLPKSVIKLEKLQYIRAGMAKHHRATEGAENPSAVAVAPVSRTCAPLASCLSRSRINLPIGSHSGVKVPTGIRKLSSLHTLGVISIHSAGEDGILEELKTLTQLHKLGVSGINRKNSEKFFSYISRLVHLESLNIAQNSAYYGWNSIHFLEISCNSRLQAVRFGSDIEVEILKIRCCSVSSSLKFYGLQGMKRLREVWLSGSYDQAFKQELKSELEKNENEPKPILK